MNSITINVHKDSDHILGKMLARGYRLDRPFECGIGVVGNVKMALTSVKKEGVNKTIISKTRITKKDIEYVSGLRDREVKEIDFIIYDILLNRIVTDSKLYTILYTVLNSFEEVKLVSRDKSGKDFLNMKLYLDTINRIIKEIKANQFNREDILFKHKYNNLSILEKLRKII
jgi:hypothetical protein